MVCQSVTVACDCYCTDITLNIKALPMKWLTHMSLMHGVIFTMILLFVFCLGLSIMIELIV